MQSLKRYAAGCVALVMAIGLAGSASAAVSYGPTVTYTEDFEADFPAWESGWLGTSSNLENYYVAHGRLDPTSILLAVACPDGAPYNTCRGNNPDGLWVSDGDDFGVGTPDLSVDIIFDVAFASTLTSLSIDVVLMSPSDVALRVFDAEGAVLLESALIALDPTVMTGAFVDPGVYQNFSLTSTTGIGGFSLIGAAVSPEGKVSIDNLIATSGAPIPEPTAPLLFGAGMLVVGRALRRRAA